MKQLLTLALSLWLAASLPAATLRLRIVDAQGAVIPAASVTVGGKTLAADSSGLVEVDAAPPLSVQASAPGFEPRAQRLESWSEAPVEIVLYPATVYSRVDVVVRREEIAQGPVTTNAVEIERLGARTVLDAIDRLLPGAFVTRRGVMGYGIAAGGTGMVFLRGIGNSPNTGVLVVIDGRPDFMGLMGHPLPDLYSLSDAAVVSVTQGPASVLYGSNAMGGAIEIKPAEPLEGMRTELSGSLGAFHTGQYRLRHGARMDRWFYNLTAGVDHTNGHRPRSHFRNQDGTLALGADLSPTWKTSLRGRYGHFVVEDPGPVTGRPGIWASVGRGGFSWNADNAAGRTWGHTRLYSSWGHHHISDGFRSNDRTTGVRLHQHFLVAPSVVADAGADVVNYGGRARNVLTRADFGAHGETSAAGFGRLHWSGNERLRFNAGLRYERSTIFGGIVAPEFGAGLRLKPGYAVHFSAARGFRNPTIRELYLFPAPNPELKPEHAWMYQASLQMQPSGTFAASLTGYYADLNNLVVVTGRFPNLALRNTGAAINRGVESTVRWRAGKRVSLHGGYAWLRSTNLPPFLPRHKATFGCELDLRRAWLSVNGVLVGRRWADLQRTRQLDGYGVHGLKLMVPVGARWVLFGVLENFTHERYEVVTGYPMPGIHASGGFTLRF